jgi:hypothetical protein
MDGGTVAPAATRFLDVRDPADDAAVIDPASAALVLRQMRPDRRPLRVARLELTSHDPPSFPNWNHVRQTKKA